MSVSKPTAEKRDAPEQKGAKRAGAARTGGAEAALPAPSSGEAGRWAMAPPRPAPLAARTAGLALQRLPADGAVSAPAPEERSGPFGAIVEDDAEPGPGQVRRTQFMTDAAAAIEAAAAAELARAGRTTQDCPYLATYLAYYRGQSAAHLERAIARYARPQRTDARSLLSAVVERVREAASRWVTTGAVDLAGLPASAPGRAASGVQGFDGAVAGDPRAIRAQLGTGRALESGVRARMEAGLGRGFGDVRIHADERASRAASTVSARAFTIGHDVAFGAGQFRPGTPAGDLMLAHELAHVVQQRGAAQGAQAFSTSQGAALEADADRAAISAGARLGLAPDVVARRVAGHTPTIGTGLRLQRCSERGRVPTGLTTLQAKAEWIRTTLQGSTSTFEVETGRPRPEWRKKDQVIVDMLATLSAAEFIDIQGQLDMNAVLDQLSDFEAVRMGTLGPLKEAGHERLNRIRARYLYQMTHDRGADEGQIVALWIFSNMHNDEIRDVLTLLGEDQHLYNTIDRMPPVLEILKDRGIDRNAFKDRSWKGGDVWSGVKHGGRAILKEGAPGGQYLLTDAELPGPFREAMQALIWAKITGAMTPGNLVKGLVNHAAFNIPSMVEGTLRGTYSGVRSIAEGHVEEGVEGLTGPVITVAGLVLGVRAFRKRAAVAALLELTEEGQGAIVRLRASIGQAGIDRVARYIKADSQAAILVREQGLAGVEALDKAKGSVAAARKLIGVDAGRLGPLLTPDTLAGLGLETQQALARLSDAALRTLAGTDAATLDALAKLLGETTPAMRARLVALAESNPTRFGELLRAQKAAVLEAIRTGPFASVDDLASAVEKSQGRVRVPVVKGGVTLYESIDPAKPPPGWKFSDTVTKRGGSVTIRTDVTGPNGAKGFFVRRLNPATGELEMLEAYLRAEESGPELPGAVPGEVELRPGKGTSTVTYATLRQLRLQGTRMGALRRIVMRNIENFRTICRLEWMRKNFPGRALDQLVLDTDSVSYASTSAEQAGSRITGGKLTGGRAQPIGNLMSRYEAEAAEGGEAAVQKVRAEHQAILDQYGLDRKTTMLTNFDIELDLEPVDAKATGSSP